MKKTWRLYQVTSIIGIALLLTLLVLLMTLPLSLYHDCIIILGMAIAALFFSLGVATSRYIIQKEVAQELLQQEDVARRSSNDIIQYKPLDQAEKIYARPRGYHYHLHIDCPLLQGGDFVRYSYVEITPEQVKQRRLLPCICAREGFEPHKLNKLTADI